MKPWLIGALIGLLLAAGRPADAPHRPAQPTPPGLTWANYLPWVGQAPYPTLRWHSRAPLLAPRSDFGAATVAGKLLVIGGWHYGGLVARVEAYDPGRDLWALRSDIPTPRERLAVAPGPDGRIYAVGGLAGYPSGEIVAITEAYDPVADRWFARASMPTPRYGLGLAAASNGRLYAVGGYLGPNAVDPTGLVEAFDPPTNTWQPRAPLPTPRGALAVATAADGRIYAAGGADYGHGPEPRFFATLEVYDPRTDAWTSRASMPTARAELALVAAGNGRLYALGGCSSLSNWLATVEEYDPATNTWRAVEPLGSARRGLAGVSGPEGQLYALGGRYFAPRGELRVVEEAVFVGQP